LGAMIPPGFMILGNITDFISETRFLDNCYTDIILGRI